MEKDFDIIFDAAAFDKNAQRSELSDVKVGYTKEIGELNRTASELDRYDDFSALRIQSDEFERSAESGIYGIVRDKTKHTDSVILAHQRSAALAFLKERRGVGLLADVVGSGKTFEACEVLSELAVRGNIRSMLLIVPEQMVEHWKETLEHCFGLGEGVLKEAGGDFDYATLTKRGSGKVLYPVAPIIVTDRNFARWGEDVAQRVLFDVIVVDEAHHLNAEYGEYAHAMKRLSLMMALKRAALKPYCLLLTATPHSGNLEQMFRLWYFIRTSGGNPEDFEQKKDEERSAEYLAEKKHFIDHVCRGAVTVMEFIKRAKIAETANDDGFKKYCASNKIKFEDMNWGEKWCVADEFLRLPKNGELAERVSDSVADAYHNGILRPIMIRQPEGNKIGKKKSVVNYMIVPASPAQNEIVIDGLSAERRTKLSVSLDKINEKDAVTIDGAKMSLLDYVDYERRYYHEVRTRQDAYSAMLKNVFNALGINDKNFLKARSCNYYFSQFSDMPECVDTKLAFLNGRSVSEVKYALLKKVLREHEHERVIIFFDYELRPDLQTDMGLFEERLKAEFADRLIIGSAFTRATAEQNFKANENAVLFVKDAAFTEGINLQDCNVIVNVQVTPDPLAMDQRIGRIFRIGQKNDVTIYSFADMKSLEGYALAYFSRIGLMSSNSGDATIIAGSNNEKMKVVQCRSCGKVKLYTDEDYQSDLKNHIENLYCKESERCVQESPKGTIMTEISVRNFRCDGCNKTFRRSEKVNEYVCMSSDENVMCNSGDKGDRTYFCSKLCAMKHCARFTEGRLKDKCAVLALSEKIINVSPIELELACLRCPNRNVCPEECRYADGDKTGTKRAIERCSHCDEALCVPKPYALEFADGYAQAKCPSCENGMLRPVESNTFATYIREAWGFRFDDGRAFCDNLQKEANKVASIKEILDKDGGRK